MSTGTDAQTETVKAFCGAGTRVQIGDGPWVTALCTIEPGHRYDHYDEALNYQWEQK